MMNHSTAAEGLARLEVCDLEIQLAGRRGFAVADVNLTVLAGRVLGLVGESGSGKTTVALSLLGYVRRGLERVRGAVLLDGTDLFTLSESQLRPLRSTRLAYVPQDPASALNPARRVGPQLAEVLDLYADGEARRARQSEVLREVGLPDGESLLNRYPHQLSGGQQQRLVLAMAFACKPALVVLDEPTTSLDVSTQRQVLETVRSLCSLNGVAAVYVSHDLAVVTGLADDLAVMYAGRVIEAGATAKVFGQPMHPYTQRLLAAVPSVEGRRELRGLDGTPPRPGHRPEGCAFAPRCSRRQEICDRERPRADSVEGRLVECFFPQSLSTSAVMGEAKRQWPVATESTLLAVDGLSSSYRGHQVLRDVGLSVRSGGCTAIVGESGSGKTTLARCIVGLHAEWSGSITLDGQRLAHISRQRPQELRRDVQYIFQNPYTSLNPRRTIGSALAEPLRYFFGGAVRDLDDRVASALETVSLPASVSAKYPYQLSGGERQRVAIARALIVEPRVVVCDEVTSSLDVSTQAIIVELLWQLRVKRNLTMLFITHNLALVRSIGDDCVVLRDGEIVESGPVERVLEHPEHAYTVGLMADSIQPKRASDACSLEAGQSADAQAAT